MLRLVFYGWNWLDYWLALLHTLNWLELADFMDGSIMKTETLQITKEILDIISEIDEFKGAWRALGALEPERLSALRHVATIESIGSSTRIEGSKLTDQEVEKLLSNLDIESFSNRDEQEVAGYAEVMETIFHNWEDISLSENYIKQLHHDLLKYSDKDERHRGEYKKFSNSVEAFDPEGKSLGVIFETTSPFDTPREMKDLIFWMQSAFKTKEQHPLLIAAVFVVSFLAIHPFQDGNGRLSRVLTALILLKSDYSYMPYSSLESVVEQNKEGYYKALRNTQDSLKKGTPDWQPWVMYFLKALQKQKRNLEKKVEREKIILGALPELSVQILEIVRERGRITISEAVKLTGASRGTLKDHFNVLVKKNYLARHGSGRGSWYGLS